jgi:hypothetical protein
MTIQHFYLVLDFFCGTTCWASGFEEVVNSWILWPPLFCLTELEIKASKVFECVTSCPLFFVQACLGEPNWPAWPDKDLVACAR